MMLSGISPETALGRIVAIRAEDDKEILNNFNKEQKRIRSSWRNRNAVKMSNENYDNAMNYFENMFRGMS